MKWTIKDFREKKYAVVNDDDWDPIARFLCKHYPKDLYPKGDSEYYYHLGEISWGSSHNLPSGYTAVFMRDFQEEEKQIVGYRLNIDVPEWEYKKELEFRRFQMEANGHFWFSNQNDTLPESLLKIPEVATPIYREEKTKEAVTLPTRDEVDTFCRERLKNDPLLVSVVHSFQEFINHRPDKVR